MYIIAQSVLDDYKSDGLVVIMYNYLEQIFASQLLCTIGLIVYHKCTIDVWMPSIRTAFYKFVKFTSMDSLLIIKS